MFSSRNAHGITNAARLIGVNGRCFFFLRLLFSVCVYCKGKKERKGTLFKCQGYLALSHTNWGHCKLKLIQIKLNQMQVFEERGKLEYPGGKPFRAKKRTNKLNPHMTPSLRIEHEPHWRETNALTTTPPLLSFCETSFSVVNVIVILYCK